MEKTILLGIIVMFSGYLLLSMPTEAGSAGKSAMFYSLGLIAIGTGCFKGNLQALVGNYMKIHVTVNTVI
jgi:POT family proton-dependent oligopeptide transporter